MGEAEERNEADSVEIVSTTAIEAQERAAIDIQIATAKRYPRDIQRVKNQMEKFATLDEETAAECFYTLKRKDADGQEKLIQGPSIRMAEIAVASYGNISAGVRIIDNDGKQITAQGVCHDLENNVRIIMETKRSIVTKYGKTYSLDMQTVTANAASAIAIRNAILKVIPRAIINPVCEKAKLVAVGDAKSIMQRWTAAVEYFSKLGKTEADLLAVLGKQQRDEITPDDIVTLIGLKNSIRDNEISIDDAFAKSAAPSEKAAEVRDKIAQGRAKNAERAKTPPPAEPTPEEVAYAAEQKRKLAAAQAQSQAEATAEEEPSQPATDDLPDACGAYRELLTSSQRAPSILQRAIDSAREKYVECAQMRGLKDIDHTDANACGQVLAEYERVHNAARGK
jgi:hypothetical protein